MRFTVTALGSTGERGVDAVVRQISNYIHGPQPTVADDDEPVDDGNPLEGDEDHSPLPEPRDNPATTSGGYYADRSNGEPGRWLGHGATELGLGGDVARGDFEALLSGRDPRTGQRLITARGSAQRVPTVGSGTVARWTPDGTLLYEEADVAATLRWSRTEVTHAIEEGELLAQRCFIAFWCGGTHTHDGDPDAGLALLPYIAEDGTRYVSHDELARVEGVVRDGATAQDVMASGDPDEELSVPEAARILGTSRSYLARLCRAYERNTDEIAASLARGDNAKTTYLVAHRNNAGNWRITRRDLADFARRRRRPAVRVGYDITATTEKSLSVLGLLGGPKVRHDVLAAIQAANDTGLAWLERHAAAARAGNDPIGVTGWTVASFRHPTSRRLDPFVHHHNVVANTVLDEHGHRRALDARRLYRSVRTASALATAQVRFELTSRLGVAYRPARHGGWEIAGIDDDTIDEFSQRSRDVQETMHELEEAIGRATTLGELRAVVGRTRPSKQRVSNEAELLQEWWDRARTHGRSPEKLRACLDRRTPTVLTRELRDQVLASLERAVTAERSIFTRSDVLATLVDLPTPQPHGDGPLVMPAAAFERLADDFLASAAVVPLDGVTGREDVLHRRDGTTIAVGGQREAEYTTAEMLAIQARTLKRYTQLRDSGAGRVDPQIIDATLAAFPELTAEQRHLVEAFCASGDGAQSAIGRPGTGKTHSMRAAVEAWQRASYRVMGTAIKAEAARHLGAECSIPAEPLAWYLSRLDDPLTSPLDARTVLIVDEASTIGDRDLDTLLWGAQQTGAAVRLLGDPEQHGSLPAGGLWRVLAEQARHRTPELTVGHRLRHAADQAAAEALRERRVPEALAALEAAGHLHIVPDERDVYVAMLDRWWESRQHGQPHPMVGRRNDERLVLNRLARRLRKQAGELGDVEIRASGDRRFAPGDEVVARMSDRSLHPPNRSHHYVRNGSRGTIVDVHLAADPSDDRISVDFADLGVIGLPRSFFNQHEDRYGRLDVGLDHAYAITSYSVEGLSFDQSSSHIDPHSTRPEVYVDITRGRNANHLFVTRPEDPLDGERLPALPPPPERHQLEHRLTRSGPEITALELDELAGPAALHARDKTLAQLTRERLAARNGDHTLLRRAERIREQQIHRQGRARPDPHLVAQLVNRPSESFLATRYDELLGDIATYRARWQPRPSHDQPWAWALGEPVAYAEATEQRRQLIGRLEDLSVQAVAHQLPGGPSTLTEADRNVISNLAAIGSLGHIDAHRLVQALRGNSADTADPGDLHAQPTPEPASGDHSVGVTDTPCP